MDDRRFSPTEAILRITQVHAHFLISIGNYSNERIGFTCEVDEGDDIESLINAMRHRACAIVGKSAEDLYNERWEIVRQIKELETRLTELRSEWDATAEFLKAQGINPTAPPMPQFKNLLAAARPNEEIIVGDDNPF